MTRTAAIAGAPSVVLVEDDADLRRMLKLNLEELGHKVVGEAADGSEMVKIVLAAVPDVIVFDIHLPGLNGLEALRRIYQERVIAAVAITADRDSDLLARALDEHVLAYLVKPVEPHHLGPALAMARTRFEELRTLSEENANLKQTLHKRKVIERAKGVLMQRHRWAEAEAFRRLQRAAMNRRASMFDLAQDVLNGVAVNL